MADIIGEDQVRRIKEAVDLVEVMGDYAPPQRAGRLFKLCCPFHQERTPSCYIYPDQQTYHCFGCGAHGDVITLVREQEGLSFTDAVEFLARRAGIQVTYEQRRQRSAQARSQREGLLALMTWSHQWLQRQLWHGEAAQEARDYLGARGIDRAIGERFGLGWAPGRGLLCQAARQEGFSPEQLISCNLAVDREGRLQDRFYGRVMFPIADRFGQTLAYSGRILPEAERRAKEAGRGVGKYINSSDTPLYHKSEVVWNLHQARSAARKVGRIVVMEGPTDVIAAAAAGIDYCVAVLGTALTPQHAKQLANVLGGDGHVTMLFDGDRAGQDNALKAVATCLQQGVPCRVAQMQAGLDPAELLASEGSAALQAILSNDRSDIDHLLRGHAPIPHGMDPRARLEALDRCLEVLRPIADEDLRREYVEVVSEWFTMDPQRLQRRLRDGSLAASAEDSQTERSAKGRADGPALRQEDEVLHLLVRYPDLRPLAFDDLGLEPSTVSEPWRIVVDILLETPSMRPDDLLNCTAIRDHQQLNQAVHRWLRDDHGRGGVALDEPQQRLRENVSALLERLDEERISLLQASMQQASRDGDQQTAMALFAEIRALRAARKHSDP
ncbi:MAG: DNA primase [Planctomycetota bacterium]|nr:MAG: DNA primase [Planctomycetota bacterium]